jgi:hypothetical protein
MKHKAMGNRTIASRIIPNYEWRRVLRFVVITAWLVLLLMLITRHHRWLWVVALIASIGGAVRDWLDRQWKKRTAAGHCPLCGYNLRHNVSGVCPECGTPFELYGRSGPDGNILTIKPVRAMVEDRDVQQ